MTVNVCPITGNVPTRMTAAGFITACRAKQQAAAKAAGRWGHAGNATIKQCLECRGKVFPAGLELVGLDDFEMKKKEEDKDMGGVKRKKDECSFCGARRKVRNTDSDRRICGKCDVVRAAIRRDHELVIRLLRKNGHDVSIGLVEMDATCDCDRLRSEVVDLGVTLNEVRRALGCDQGDDVVEAAERRMNMLAKLDALYLDQADELDKVRVEFAKAARQEGSDTERSSVALFTVPSDGWVGEYQAGFSAEVSETESAINAACMEISAMLVEKNKAYGDSAMDPVRIFSKADPEEQLLVRIDDKLSRLARGQEYPGDDTVMDLVGYLVLLLVAREQREMGCAD